MRRPWLAGPVLLGCGVWIGGGLFARASDSPDPIVLTAGTAGMPSAVASAGGEPIRATLDRITILEPGTSSREASADARKALPLDRLTPENRGRVAGVLDNVSMFRAMPTLRLAVDHAAYRYFVENPDVAVSVWRALGVSKCQMWQTGPDTYEADVGDGSVGVVEVVHRGDNDHVAIVRGRFKSPLLVKPIDATAVLHLRTDYVTRADGETEVVCRSSLFVSFPSQTVGAAAKVISPVTNVILDRNCEEIGLFAHMMTLAMWNRPGWVEDLTGRLDGVLERRKPELLQVTARAFVAHRRRTAERDGLPATADNVLAPVRQAAGEWSR